MPVDDVALGDALGESPALAVVGNRLLRLEGIALGIVDHAQAIECLTGGQRCRHIALEGREKSLRPMLEKLEEAVAQLSAHGEGEVDARHIEGSGRLLLFRLGDDAPPLVGAHEEIVFDEVVFQRVEGVDDKEAPHPHKDRHLYGDRQCRLAHGGQQCHDEGQQRRNQLDGGLKHRLVNGIAVIVDADEKAAKRILQVVAAEEHHGDRIGHRHHPEVSPRHFPATHTFIDKGIEGHHQHARTEQPIDQGEAHDEEGRFLPFARGVNHVVAGGMIAQHRTNSRQEGNDKTQQHDENDGNGSDVHHNQENESINTENTTVSSGNNNNNNINNNNNNNNLVIKVKKDLRNRDNENIGKNISNIIYKKNSKKVSPVNNIRYNFTQCNNSNNSSKDKDRGDKEKKNFSNLIKNEKSSLFLKNINKSKILRNIETAQKLRNTKSTLNINKNLDTNILFNTNKKNNKKPKIKNINEIVCPMNKFPKDNKKENDEKNIHSSRQEKEEKNIEYTNATMSNINGENETIINANFFDIENEFKDKNDKNAEKNGDEYQKNKERCIIY